MPRPRRRARIAWLSLAALTLLLAATWGRSALDRWLRARLAIELARTLGPAAELGRVETQPWRLGIRVDDVRVAIGSGGSRLEAARIRARLDLGQLVRRRITLAALELERATIDLDLDDPEVKARLGAGGGPSRHPIVERLRLSACELRLRSKSSELALAEVAGTATLGVAGTASAALTFAVRGLTIDRKPLHPGRARIDLARAPSGAIDPLELAGELATGPFELHGKLVAAAAGLTLDARLETELDTAALVRALGGRDQLAGAAHVSGQLDGPLDQPRFRGRLESARLVGVGVVPLEAVTGTLLAGRSMVRLLEGRATLWGGAVELSGEAPLGGPDPVRLRFRARDIELSRVHAGVAGFPLRSGHIDVDQGLVAIGRGGRPTTVDGRVLARAVEPTLRAELADERLQHMLSPFSGTADLHFESGVVEVRNADLTSVWSHARGAGSFPLTGPVQCELELTGAALAPVITTPGPEFGWLEGPSHYRLDGTIDGDLAWTGRGEDVVLEFSGTAASALLEGPLPGQGGAAAELVDSRLELRYAGRALDWSAEGGGSARWRAQGRAEFPLDDLTRQALTFASEEWDAGVLAQAIAFPLPWRGRAAASGELRSDGRSWSGPLRLRGAAGPAGRSFDRTEVELELSNAAIGFRRLRLDAGSGYVEAAGSLSDPGRAFELRGSAHALPLAAFGPQPSESLDGVLDGELSLAGPWPGVAGEGTFTLTGLHLRNSPVGELRGTIAISPRMLAIAATRDPDLQARLELSLEPPRPWTLAASLDALELGRLLRPLERRLEPLPDIAVWGRIDARGRLDSERPLDALTATVERLAISGGGLDLRSDQPFSLAWTPGEGVTLGEVALLGAETRLLVSGTAQIEPRSLDFRLAGSTDLRLLRSLAPGLGVSGRLELDARLHGPLAALELDGEARLAKGLLRSEALPYPLRDVAARARLAGRRVELDGLSARFGAGQILATGELSLPVGSGPSARLAVTGTDLQLKLYRDLELRTDADVTYQIDQSGRSLSGQLGVTRAVYRAPREGFGARAEAASLGDAAHAPALEGFTETRLDLEIAAPGNLWYVSDEAKLEGDAVLRIGGTTSDPTLLGSIRYLSQERLKLEGRHYRVQRGYLVFDNPRRPDPRIDFEAETSLSGYRIVLGLTGRLSNPQVTARSDPPLAQGDVLALLVGGRPEQGFGVIGPTGSQEIFRSLFLPQTVSVLTGGRVFIDPTALSGRADPTELLPLSVPVGQDLDVVLGLPLREARPGLFVLNWRAFGGFSLSAVRDLDRGWGAELVHELRFGGPRQAVATGPLVRELRIDADPTVPASELLRQVSLRPGRRATRGALRDDLERLRTALRARGWPLARVGSAVLRDADGEGAEVTFTIEVGPRVAIETPGASFGADARDQLLATVETFGLYEETHTEIERVARAAEEAKGHARSLVSCEQGPLPGGAAGDVRIACEVEPGQRFKLREIAFEGNLAIGASQLRQGMRTHAQMFRATRLVTTDVEDDLRHVAWLYQEEGYLDARARAEIRDTPDPDALDLVIHVTEGPRWTLGEVELTGTTPLPLDSLRAELRLTPGTPFRNVDIRTTRDRLFNRHDTLGYMDARVRTESRRDPATHTIALRFVVEAGEPARVGEIRIDGLERTRPGVVRGQLRFSEGGLLSYDRVARSQRRLYELGVFRSVEIRTEPAASGAGRDVRVQVEEAAPYRLEGGAGYDSEEGLRGHAELSDTNFAGRGQFLGLQLRASQRLLRAQLLFREPRAFGLPFSGLLTAYYEDREEVSFDEEVMTLLAEAGHVFGRGRRSLAALRYSLSDTRLTRLEVSPIEAGAEDVRLSSLGASLAMDRRDDVLTPRRGWLGSADLEWSAPALGSEAEFAKLTLKWFGYRPLLRGLTFASGAQIGLASVNGADGRLPLAERYFSGGATTLRGIGFNRAGPLDAVTGEPTGGNAVVVCNEELRVDLLRRFVGTAFVDVGEVFRTNSDIAFSELRWSVGLGLRYRGPVLAGIDWARLIEPRPDESTSQLHFTLGYAF